MNTASNTPRSAAPPLPVFDPAAHRNERQFESIPPSPLAATTNTRSCDSRLTPLLEVGDREDTHHSSGRGDGQFGAAPLKRKRGLDNGSSSNDHDTACMTKRCLWGFLVASIVSNVLFLGGVVGVYVFFGSTAPCPALPSVPPATGQNFTCNMSAADKQSSTPVLKLGSNDSSSVDFCWCVYQSTVGTSSQRPLCRCISCTSAADAAVVLLRGLRPFCCHISTPHAR